MQHRTRYSETGANSSNTWVILGKVTRGVNAQTAKQTMTTHKPETQGPIEATDKPTTDNATVETSGDDSDKSASESDTDGAVNFFQAIGVLSGKLIFDAGFKIELAGKRYNVRFKKDTLMYFVKLGEVGRFAVYPKITHFPKPDVLATIWFEIVAVVNDGENSSGIFEKLQDNEFLLRGLWQFIPVCRTPVISVLYNYNDDLLAKIARLDTAAKCKKLKAQHLPLVWKPPIVPAFRYKKDSETQDDKYFISVKAKLDIKCGEFIFDSLIGIPTTEVPKGFIVGKQMKAEALQIRNERAGHSGRTDKSERTDRSSETSHSTTNKNQAGKKSTASKATKAPANKPAVEAPKPKVPIPKPQKRES
jgi:hypothetical protein